LYIVILLIVGGIIGIMIANDSPNVFIVGLFVGIFYTICFEYFLNKVNKKKK